MTSPKDPSSELRQGRRALEGVPAANIIEDLTWDDERRSWRLCLDLDPGIREDPWIPDVVRIHLLINPHYPWGSIRLFPDKERGFSATFQHQLYNAPGPEESPYRLGEICVRTEMRPMGSLRYDQEPRSAERRLRWNVERVCDWLRRASEGRLVEAGEWFELPNFPCTRAGKGRVVFSEDEATFEQWQSIEDRVGIARIAALGSPSVWLVRSFDSLSGSRLVAPVVGTWLCEAETRDEIGVWIRLDRVPVLQPWEAPTTWGDLRTVADEQRIQLDRLLRQAVPRLRDGLAHFALVGFPIPHRVDASPAIMHWQALKLPELRTRSSVPAGFRRNERGFWQGDRRQHFETEHEIEWVGTENWSRDQLTVRGALDDKVKEKRLVVIGAGAVGSSLLDVLARGGLTHVTIFDGEVLEAGNLARHRLTVQQVKQPKALSLARYLNSASPGTNAKGIDNRFSAASCEAIAAGEASDAIVDCTANDDTLEDLSRVRFAHPKLFVSISLGPFAKHLFFFTSHVGMSI